MSLPDVNVPYGATQLTLFMAEKKLEETMVVLKKSARALSFCCDLSMFSRNFCLAAWLPA